MDELKQKIMASRKLREASIRTYLVNIKKLHQRMGKEGDVTSLDFLKDHDAVMRTIKDTKLSSRKTALASIVVALSAYGDKYDAVLKKYRDDMYSDAAEYKKVIEGQRKSEREDKNWTTLKRLKSVLARMKKDLQERGVFKRDELSRKEMGTLQQWVVGMIYIGDDKNPPLRNDITPMAVIDLKDYRDLSDEALTKNYLVVQSRNKKFFSLGEYKTAGKYGLKRIDLGGRLNSVMNIWLKYNRSKSLINNSKGEPMSPNGLTKLLNKTFESTGKNIGSTLLRHIYITEKFPPTDTLKEKQAVADKMGHSTATQELYKKN